MKKISLFLLAFLLVVACQNAIKSTQNPVQVEAGTDTSTLAANDEAQPIRHIDPQDPDEPYVEILGYWVGNFEVDRKKVDSDADTYVSAGDAFYWNRSNKINISIDRITEDSTLIGHSVVAGNDRPFKGTIRVLRNEWGQPIYQVEVKEPGDDRYDGVFRFKITEGRMNGTWEAYNDLKIKYRVYELEHRIFEYDASIALQPRQRYVDWNNKIQTEETWEEMEGVEETWIREEFATSTGQIYELNASARLLTREEVANLKRGDLIIIRNTIYARHGYSFKNRPLRVFFDAQPWYIPVHADIRSDFTETEKQNINLLLSFEENAAEYYDAFGRG